MQRFFLLATAGLFAMTSVAAAPNESRPAPDHEVELLVGESAHVDGGAPQGVNPLYFDADAGCSKEATSYCEWTLVHVVTEVPADVERGRLRTPLNIVLTSPDFTVSDFDLVVWESNADGDRLAEVGSSGSGGYQDAVEQVNVSVSTTPDVMDAWFLVDAVYFLGGPNYDLDITFG